MTALYLWSHGTNGRSSSEITTTVPAASGPALLPLGWGRGTGFQQTCNQLGLLGLLLNRSLQSGGSAVNSPYKEIQKV